MNQIAPRESRRSMLVNLAWATVLVVLLLAGYVLSYPIVLRACTRSGEAPPKIILYKPVEVVVFGNQRAFNAMYSWSGWCGADELVLIRDLQENVFYDEPRPGIR